MCEKFKFFSLFFYSNRFTRNACKYIKSPLHHYELLKYQIFSIQIINCLQRHENIYECTCLHGINSLRLITFKKNIKFRSLSVQQVKNVIARKSESLRINKTSNGDVKKLFIVVCKIIIELWYFTCFIVFRMIKTLSVTNLILLVLLSMSISQATSSSSSGYSAKYGTNIVKTKYGLLRGVVFKSPPSVEAFLGIPYASPPVGSLRFMPPITPSSWKNIRNADRFSAVCPQSVPIPPNGPEALLEIPRARLAQLRRLMPLLKNQSEDCLYLNIYVPLRYQEDSGKTSGDKKSIPKGHATNESAKLLSTILFIHGESYDWNSGNPYDGSQLASHGNVIVVTINFRLGIFGFLKTGGKESAQGNFGLMDLVAGLHWLKENLPAFGGDPHGVTILGHGCGAALANILIVSPVASDLLQRAVLVSGSALSPWAIQKDPLLVKRRVAEQTGCHGDLLYDDIAPCLRTKTVAQLLSVKINHPRFLVGFGPFIDGTVISPNTDGIPVTLPLGSTIISTSGIEFANFPKRDLIFGLTSVESYLDLSAQDLEFGLNETRRDRILRTFVRNIFHYHLNEIFAVLKNEYTDWEKVLRSPFSSRDATLSFLSDGHTASSLVKLGYMHSLRGGRTYFLHFKLKTVEEEFPQRAGSVRGEDIPFWLGLPSSPLFPHNYTSQDKKISQLMLRYLSNFAKTGNPNQSLPWLYKPSSELKVNQNIYQHFDDNFFSVNVSKNEKVISKKRSANLLAHPRSRRHIQNDGINESHTISESRKLISLKRRSYFKRHLNTNENNISESFLKKLEDNPLSDLPFWDAYDSVNQLYLELGNNVQVRRNYRGHKLSMWLNLIPQLHKHSNLNDLSLRHHQFAEEHIQFYDGIVRPQLQNRPPDTDEIQIIDNPASMHQSKNQNFSKNENETYHLTSTECAINETVLIPDVLTPRNNRSSNEYHKFKNLEVLRRLSGKQFQSYTTALVATVAVGCFLLVLNIFIFAAIYHQREKRARDTKTKEELQDDSCNQLRACKLPTNPCSYRSATFGEYNCYDEKSLLSKQSTNVLIDNSTHAASTTLDLLKTNVPLESSNSMFIKDANNLNLPQKVNENLEMPSLPQPDSSFEYTELTSQISFKEIEDAIKCSSNTEDFDIPDPPPPPRSFQQCKGGILRQTTGSNATVSVSNKKRVHIQEISV